MKSDFELINDIFKYSLNDPNFTTWIETHNLYFP